MIVSVFELSFCDVAVTLTLYSPADVRDPPDTVIVTFLEAPAASDTEEELNVAVASPEVVKRIVSESLPVFVTRNV